MLRSNIYKSKHYDIQYFASLVLDVFYKLLRKNVVFLEAQINIKFNGKPFASVWCHSYIIML